MDEKLNDLNILKDVGLKEVARKTHIEPDFLQAVIDKDFEKLAHTNANGYIKIIQREYNVNLSSWLEEFEEYKKEHNLDEPNKMRVNPKVKQYSSNTDGLKYLNGGSIGWFLWFMILIAFFVLAYYFDAHKYIEELPKYFENDEKNASYSTTSVVQEVKKNMKIIEQNTTSMIVRKDENTSIQVSITPVKDTNLSEKNVSITQPIKLPTLLVDENSSLAKTALLDTNSTPKIDTNSSLAATPTTPTDANATALGEIQKDIGVYLISSEGAVFTPRARVWRGVIDIKTGKKISRTTTESFEAPSEGEWLVAYGNGNIELRSKTNELKTFDGGRAARFLIRNGQIRFLTYDEFLSLNGGKSW
ncbi:MAG: hypothetical protein K5978_08220 [Campylobacter sp.]|nr:hypothetical protein [Campylobacter sp.]